MKKIFNWVRKTYEKFKLENVALASVIVVQALKRVAQSNFTLLLLELAPLSVVNVISKLLGYISKANDIVPKIAYNVVITKGIVEDTSIDPKLALEIFVDHLRYQRDKEAFSQSLRDFALDIVNTLQGDGVITDDEKRELIEKYYMKLFKQQQE